MSPLKHRLPGKSIGSPVLLAVLLVVLCVGLAAGGASLALIQPSVSTVNADLTSRLSADYSTGESVQFAPLDPRIVEVVRADEAGLDGGGGNAEIVQVFYEDPPVPGANNNIFVNAPPPTPSPGAEPPPPAGSTDSPTPTLKPGSTPGPTPRVDVTPTLRPTPGPVVTPPPTPVPTPTPAPTPPPPSWTGSCYLHNVPSPPTGHTTSTHDLPCGATPPTAGTLYNYDTNFDQGPGRALKRTNNGANEESDDKHQHWATPMATIPITMNGTASVEIWIAAKDFQPGKSLKLSAYILDGSSQGYYPIAQGHISMTSTGSWSLATINVGINHVLQPGHLFEIKLVTQNESQEDIWAAYDTATYKSRFVSPQY